VQSREQCSINGALSHIFSIFLDENEDVNKIEFLWRKYEIIEGLYFEIAKKAIFVYLHLSFWPDSSVGRAED
jgi:hypothetical protein